MYRKHFIWQDFVDAKLVIKGNRFNLNTNKFERVEYIKTDILFELQRRLKRNGIDFIIPRDIQPGSTLTQDQFQKIFVDSIQESRRTFSAEELDPVRLQCLGEVGSFGI